MTPSHDSTQPRATLDPADWSEFRAIAHTMLDDMVNYLSTVRDRPAWQSPSADARDFLSTSAPRAGRDLAAVYTDFKQHILPYPTGNIHPRFWGWVIGTGTPVGMLADLLGGAMNCPVSGYDQGASLVEHQVLHWLAELLDYPPEATGLLTSGGTVANLIGLLVARNHATDQRIRKDGVNRERDGQMTIYASTAVHGWADRSCDWVGLGGTALRKVPVNDRHQIKVDELARMIRDDRARGLRPICIIGTAGTVSCGATDDLNALADLAQTENLWYHVDGAFGALAKLSPKYRHIASGLERADSLAFDLHKWGYMQYEVGVVLVKDPKIHLDSFAYSSSYLDKFRGGIAINPIEFSSRGLQLSRGFRALKVWMQLSAYGTDRLGAVIEQNIDDVQYLKSRIQCEPRLELLGPADMNVCCFRYVPEPPPAPPEKPTPSPEQLDALNTEILIRVQESGVAVPSNARIDGRFAIRVANVNHRSRREDFDVLVEAVLSAGEKLE